MAFFPEQMAKDFSFTFNGVTAADKEN